jgi:hypothetical protein
METAVKKVILAAVAVAEGTVSGGVPVFHAKDKKDQEFITLTLSRVLEAVAHDLGNGTYILVRH